jgi:hypothetical protein
MNEQDRFAEDGQSTWNNAAETLRSIRELQTRLNMYREGNTWAMMAAARDALDSLQSELVGYMSAEELKAVEKARVPVLPNYYGMKSLGRVPPSQLKERLRNWELLLRRVIVKKGMGLVAKDTDSVFILPGGK